MRDESRAGQPFVSIQSIGKNNIIGFALKYEHDVDNFNAGLPE